MEVDVDGVESDEEVTEDILLGLGDVGEEGRDKVLSVRELRADGDQELQGLGVDISDLDTTLVGEEDPVTLSGRVDTDVVLGVGRVGREWLDDKGVEGTGGLFDRDGLARTRLDPGSSLLPLLVEAQETGLSSSLDQLIRLSDELRVEDPFGQTGSGLDLRDERLARWVAAPLVSHSLMRRGRGSTQREGRKEPTTRPGQP